MSASLPRIKTVRELSGLPKTESQKDFKLKFKKLLDVPANGQQRRPLVIKTERLKSLSHYSTTQQQRDYKNEKIHLNLIERKLLSGTYDQKKQTAAELNIVKQKRDHLRVQMTLKQREIQRVRLMLEDVKLEMAEYLNRKGEYDQRLQEIQAKHEVQLARAETARENRFVLESMIKARVEMNINYTKRNNELKERAASLANGMNLIDNQVRESVERCGTQEARLEQLLRESVQQRQQRNEHIYKHQQRINRRKDGEVQLVQKSRKYISQLDQVERRAQARGFHELYDKVLAGVCLRRFLQGEMVALELRYDGYEHSYNSVTSYHSFDAKDPKSLGVRFQEHAPENARLQMETGERERLIGALEARREQLRRELAAAQMELSMTEEQYSQTFDGSSHTAQHAQILRLKTEAELLEQRGVRIKTTVLRLLKELNQKGDKKIYSGAEVTVSNLQQLTSLLRESYRQLQ